MVQPAASAGATFQAAISMGKFQGMIAPATPTGSLTALDLKVSNASAMSCCEFWSSFSASSA